MALKVRTLNSDDYYQLAKRKQLKIHGKTVETPLRALSASPRRAYSEALNLKHIMQPKIIELYKRLTRERIIKLLAKPQPQRELALNYEISTMIAQADPDKDVTLAVVEYQAEGKNITPQEIELLASLLNNPYFDLAATPIITGIDFDTYLEAIEKFIETWQTATAHPQLVVAIPHISSPFIIQLLDCYLQKPEIDLRFIAYDFNGGNPISQYTIVATLARKALKLSKELGEDIHLHALNLKYGKTSKKQEIVPAKDLLAYLMNFNSYGPNHKPAPIFEDIGEYELKTKLLNLQDYGYYPISQVKKRAIQEPPIYKITLNQILKEPKQAKLYNAERQTAAANEIAQHIKEKALKQLIQKKKQIAKPELLKKIKKAEQQALQEKLP